MVAIWWWVNLRHDDALQVKSATDSHICRRMIYFPFPRKKTTSGGSLIWGKKILIAKNGGKKNTFNVRLSHLTLYSTHMH
jgi:hypothetical protein